MNDIENLFEKVGKDLSEKNWDEALQICNQIIKIDSDDSYAYQAKLLAEAKVTSFADLKNVDYPLEELQSYKKVIELSDEDTVNYIRNCNQISKNNYSKKVLSKRNKIMQHIDLHIPDDNKDQDNNLKLDPVQSNMNNANKANKKRKSSAPLHSHPLKKAKIKKIICIIGVFFVVLLITITSIILCKNIKVSNQIIQYLTLDEFDDANIYYENTVKDLRYESYVTKKIDAYVLQIIDSADINSAIIFANSSFKYKGSNFEVLKTWILDTVIQKANECIKTQTNYEEVLGFLNKCKNLNEERKKEVNSCINDIKDIDSSKKNYQAAEQNEKSGKLLLAVTYYEKVSSTDNLYNAAQNRIAELEPEIVKNEVERAELYANLEDYNYAVSIIDGVIKYYPNNEILKAKNLEYTQSRKNKSEQEQIEKLQERIELLQNSIRVHKCFTGKPNSASGVDLYITYENMSDTKVIKYITFTVIPFNNVDDITSCTVRHNSEYHAGDVGSFKKGQGNLSTNLCWENAWYNNTITYCKIIEIQITYMDGSTLEINQSEIQYIKD